MKILFIGSIEFSKHILLTFLENDLKIDHVITKKKSPFNSDFNDLSNIASKNHIDVSYSKSINSRSSLKKIIKLNPDLIICIGWSEIIQEKILNIPKYGVIGYHPSLLPQNRGRHPIIWSLALGLSETGSSFFLMNKKADSGDIISQKRLKIAMKDDASSLYKKLLEISKKQIPKIISQINKKRFTIKKQNNSNSNKLRKRSLKDGEIDWRMGSETIYNLIRALTKPYVGAHFYYNKKKIKVWKAIYSNKEIKNIEPGKVLAFDSYSVRIKCGKGIITLLDYSPRIKFKIGKYL